MGRCGSPGQRRPAKKKLKAHKPASAWESVRGHTRVTLVTSGAQGAQEAGQAAAERVLCN